MKMYQILLCFFLLLVACKKEPFNIEKPISTWEDTQKVRIMKVELKKMFISPPINGDTSFYVDYQYDMDNQLYQVVANRKSNSYDIQKHSISEGNQNLNTVYNFSSCIGYEWLLINNSIKFNDNRIDEISGNYKICHLGMTFLNTNNRISTFKYDKNGLLNNIQSNIDVEEMSSLRTGTDIFNTTYNGNQLLSYQVKSYSFISYDSNEVENYQVDVKYTIDNNIPNGLSRMVNQAILGINSIGFDDFYITPEIQNISDITINFPEASASVFLDWIISFGSSRIQTLPAQNVGIVSSKRIYGKRVADFSEEGDKMFDFLMVDSTANFPYIHDASAKTLEIAGLKIWYELVE